MATIQGSTKQTKVSINKFLGLYEAPDGDTQLRPGVATEMRNFEITQNYHLQTRPGMRTRRIMDGELLAMWQGYYGGVPLSLYVTADKIYIIDETSNTDSEFPLPASPYPYATVERAHVFDFGGRLYLLTNLDLLRLEPGSSGGEVSLSISTVTGYVPLVVTGASPSGGGTSLERANLLNGTRRVQYNGNGTATSYVLPEDALQLVKVVVDNVEQTLGGTGWVLDPDGKTAKTQGLAPPAGVNNVEITYEAPESNRQMILAQRYTEAFNGSTDTRIFVYGDGTNITYYSGITEAGEPTAEYFPALNEIAVGASNAPITGMVRHYARLMVFKPDGCYAISYEVTYLADGIATAGFHLRPMHRELGSDAMGQIVVSENSPRTFCRGNLIKWKQTASYYQDERYAENISLPVAKSFRLTDKARLYLFDDDARHRMYAFLNDDAGTVLVNDYELDCWYKWDGFFGVHHMIRTAGDRLMFSSYNAVSGKTSLNELWDTLSYDYVLNTAEEPAVWERRCIDCVWESGHMAFGTESTRKYSSYLWATLLAGPGAIASFTARTDRRAEYAIKTDYANTTGLFDAVEFDRFSFETYLAPFAKRLKLKVKKFVYYKLIITSEDRDHSDEPFYPQVWPTYDEMPTNDGGAGNVCVLNVDIKLRQTSDAK